MQIDPKLPQVRTKIQKLGEQLAAEKLPTGGSTELFEAIGRHQLIKLIQNGLLPDSYVLDVGCGALRGGYWLIHFLRPDRYCGIEPNKVMLAGGIRVLLSPEILSEKRPAFDHNRDFNFGVFGRKFDFVLARSIWSHASLLQIDHMLGMFISTSSPDGILLTSWIPTKDPAKEYAGNDFSWPAIRYRRETLIDRVERAGLCAEVQDAAQGQVWLRVSKSRQSL